MISIEQYLDKEYPRIIAAINHKNNYIRILSDLDHNAYVVVVENELDPESIDLMPENYEKGFDKISHAMMAVVLAMGIDSQEIFRLIGEKADRIDIYYIDGVLN